MRTRPEPNLQLLRENVRSKQPGERVILQEPPLHQGTASATKVAARHPSTVGARHAVPLHRTWPVPLRWPGGMASCKNTGYVCAHNQELGMRVAIDASRMRHGNGSPLRQTRKTAARPPTRVGADSVDLRENIQAHIEFQIYRGWV